ncbi:MAG: hypothetical protein ACRCWQ_10545 [Bacilli bacterium]
MKKNIIYGLLAIALLIGGFFAFQMRPPTHDEDAQAQLIEAIKSNKTIDLAKMVDGDWDRVVVFDKATPIWNSQYNSFKPKLDGKTQYLAFFNESRVLSYVQIPKEMSSLDVDTYHEFDNEDVKFFGKNRKLDFLY